MGLAVGLLAAVLGALAAIGAAAPPASAADTTRPSSLQKPPAGYELSGKQAISIANREAKVRSERRKREDLSPTAYSKGPGRWQVSYFDGPRGGRRTERAQVIIDDRTGSVLETWTGPQVRWRMARGYDGAFGHKLNAPYIWIPLCLLFLAPFIDLRRPLRLLHLDLLVLLAFSVSHIFFNRGEIATSVPLIYPVLLYLLVRVLIAGFRPRERRQPLVPHAPLWLLALALVFLLGFRVALNVLDSGVIDVGYSGVIGADRIVDGEELYGNFPDDNDHGDTYGPLTYLLYVPFEQALSWSGTWDDLPAAHGAAIAFDLLTALGLFVFGRRLRPGEAGTLLGTALAFAWCSYPYSMFALQSNANDSLVAALLVWALVALSSAPARGALMAASLAAKFAPVALVPLFAAGSGERNRRALTGFAAAFVALTVLVFLPFLPDGGVSELWDRTLGYQSDRGSPFSIWGTWGLEPLRIALAIAGAGLALAVFLVPKRRSPIQVAALGAAVLISAQLVVEHWFYLYVVWFSPFVLVALLAPLRDGTGEPAPIAEQGPGERAEAEPALA